MIENALLSVGLLIVVAKLLEGVLRRFRINAIVAYTATGILLGPVAGVIEPTGEMQILPGIGIFLLFFLIGLDELDISGFMLTPPAINAVIRRTRSPAPTRMPEPLPPSLARFALDDITVGDILDRTRTFPGPSLSVRAFADRWIAPHQQDYVIVDKGELAGIVSLPMLRYVPKESWSTTRLAGWPGSCDPVRRRRGRTSRWRTCGSE